jgi:hypothetical protein
VAALEDGASVTSGRILDVYGELNKRIEQGITPLPQGGLSVIADLEGRIVSLEQIADRIDDKVGNGYSIDELDEKISDLECRVNDLESQIDDKVDADSVSDHVDLDSIRDEVGSSVLEKIVNALKTAE